jgi:iron complex outermembrane receptor protein
MIATLSFFLSGVSADPGTASPDVAPFDEMALFREIPSVYGASKYEQKVTDAPSSVCIVTASEIRKYGYRTLADILRSLRGFFTTYDRNYTYVGIRGFDRPGDYNTRLLLLLDGHRINDMVYDQAPVGYDFILDLDLVDRVEVIRGPSSSLYGSNAFFGVINVITRRGRDLKGVEVSGEAGRFDTFKGRVSYGGKFGSGLETILSGTLFDSRGPDLYFREFDDPSTNNGNARKKDGENFRSFFSSFSFEDLTLQGAYVKREKAIPTGSYGTLFDDPRNMTIDEHYFADLKYVRNFDARTTLTGRVFYDWYGYRGDYAFQDNTVNPDPPFHYVNRDKTANEWWGAELRLTSLLADRHKVTAGIEYVDVFRLEQRNFNVDPSSPVLDDRRSAGILAFSLQDEFEIRNDLTANIGVRHDRYETFGSSTNPRIALIYKPFDGSSLKLLYGRAFRAPNAYELYYADGGATQKQSPGLRPETIDTYETAWEQYIGEHYRVVAAAYYYKIKGLISQQRDPADGLSFFGNIDSVRAKGFEFEADGYWGGGLEGRVSYSVQHAENTQAGQSLSNSPRHLAKANLVLPLARENPFLGMELQYMSRRKTLSGNSTGGFLVANATLSTRHVLGGLEASASVYNLFNEKYGDPGATEHIQDIILQDGRSFRLKVTYTF